MSVEPVTLALPKPIVTSWSADFRAGLERGPVPLQRCNACATLQGYPKPLCRNCGSRDLGWIVSSGDAVVYTWTTVVANPPTRLIAQLALHLGDRGSRRRGAFSRALRRCMPADPLRAAAARLVRATSRRSPATDVRRGRRMTAAQGEQQYDTAVKGVHVLGTDGVDLVLDDVGSAAGTPAAAAARWRSDQAVVGAGRG